MRVRVEQSSEAVPPPGQEPSKGLRGTTSIDTPEDPSSESLIKIYAGKLFDSYTRTLVKDQLITVSKATGLITSVRRFHLFEDVHESDTVIDLRTKTVLPGFVDVHVHCERRSETLAFENQRKRVCILTQRLISFPFFHSVLAPLL